MTAPGTIRFLKHLLGVLGALPLFLLAGTLASYPFIYGFHSEDIEGPSGDVTVIGVWDYPESATPYCRAFVLRELQPHLDTLSIRFRPTQAELTQCQEAIAAYDLESGWSRTVIDGERRFEAFGLDVAGDALEPVFTVWRFHGDAISTTTRYTVTAGGSITNLKTKSGGPGHGVGMLFFGGGAGFLGWCVWVLWLIGASIRRRARRA